MKPPEKWDIGALGKVAMALGFLNMVRAAKGLPAYVPPVVEVTDG